MSCKDQVGNKSEDGEQSRKSSVEMVGGIQFYSSFFIAQELGGVQGNGQKVAFRQAKGNT